MNDTISRQATIEAAHKNYDGILDFRSDGETVAQSFEDILTALPSAQQKGDIDEAVEYIKNAQEYLRDIGETWCANYLSDAVELLVGERGEDGFQKTLYV